MGCKILKEKEMHNSATAFHRLRALLFAGSLPVLATMPVLAQPVEGEQGGLEAIIVTATRTPVPILDVAASASIVTRSQFQDAQAQDLAGVLRRVPGMNFGGGPRPAGQIPAIRGQSGARIVLSVDGARRNYAGGVYSPLALDPDFISRVELVRGAASASYGNGGMGGVLAFQTIDPEDFLATGASRGGQMKLAYHQGDEGFAGNLTGAARIQGVGILASGTYRHQNDIETGDGGTLLNDNRLNAGLLKGTYDFGQNSRLELSYKRQNDHLLGPNNPSGNNNFQLRQLLKRDQEEAVANLTLRRDGWLDAIATAYYNDLRIDTQSRAVTPVSPTAIRVETTGGSLQNSNQFDTGSFIAHRLTYGVDGYQDQYRDRTGAAANPVNPDGKSSTVAAFVQDEIRIAQNWILTGALRYDNYTLSPKGQAKTEEDRFTPKVSLQWHVVEAFSVYGAYGKGFRLPGFGEAFSNLSTRQALFNFRPNPDLRPESSNDYELGASLRLTDLALDGDVLRVKASWFSEDVKDLIDRKVVGTYLRQTPFAGTGSIFQSQNVSNAERKGAEVELSYGFGPVDLGLALSRLRVTDKATGAGLFAPPDKAVLTLAHDFGGGWRLNSITQFVDKQQRDATLLRRRDGYVLQDIGVSWDQGWLRLDLGVSNLFDKAYVTYQQSQADTVTYEEGRSINATATLRF